MHTAFTVKPLAGPLIDKAYPFAPALGLADLASWRAFVAGYGPSGGDSESGVIAAEDPRGYVAGVLFYHVNRHSKEGASLVCDPFLVADLPRYETPVRALLEAVDRVALRLDCRWVRVVLPAMGDPLEAEGAGCEAALFRAGYALESLNFRRRRALPIAARPRRAPGPTIARCKPRVNAR
jgi:hypothetical protein